MKSELEKIVEIVQEALNEELETRRKLTSSNFEIFEKTSNVSNFCESLNSSNTSMTLENEKEINFKNFSTEFEFCFNGSSHSSLHLEQVNNHKNCNNKKLTSIKNVKGRKTQKVCIFFHNSRMSNHTLFLVFSIFFNIAFIILKFQLN